MQRRPRIAVVMSTYNGAAYVAEQLDSILAQDVRSAAELRVYVRDDGSTDGTCEVLARYEDEGVQVTRGENLGVVRSFFAAIEAVPEEVDYLAVSDQDDVWHSDKLSRALGVLQGRDQGVPQLYCSEYVFCDERLVPQGRSHLNRIGVGFPTMLYETVVSGNTCVMNQALVRLLRESGSRGVYGHDWWFGLVAAGLGELYFDDFCSLDYRRLSSSVSPTGGSALAILRKRIQLFVRGGQLRQIDEQLVRFHDLYGERLSEGDLALIDRLCNGGRIRKALTPVRLRQKPQDELALRLLFLAGAL